MRVDLRKASRTAAALIGLMLAWCHVAWCQAFDCTGVAFFLSQGTQLLIIIACIWFNSPVRKPLLHFHTLSKKFASQQAASASEQRISGRQRLERMLHDTQRQAPRLGSMTLSYVFDRCPWVKTYVTIFGGMNIHLPSILMFTRVPGFWPMAR